MTAKKVTLKEGGATIVYPQTTEDMVFIEGDANNKTLRNYIQENDEKVNQLGQEVYGELNYTEGCYINSSGELVEDENYCVSDEFALSPNNVANGVIFYYGTYTANARIVIYNSSHEIIYTYGLNSGTTGRILTSEQLTENAAYVRYSFSKGFNAYANDYAVHNTIWAAGLVGGDVPYIRERLMPSPYFINKSSKDIRVKELYLTGLDSSKRYYFKYLRVYGGNVQGRLYSFTFDDYSDEQYVANADTPSGKFKGIFAVSQQDSSGISGYIIYNLSSTDTTNFSSEIDIAVCSNIDFSPDINISINKGKVNDNEVSTSKIVDFAVSTQKIEGEAITREKLATAAVEEDTTIFFEKGYNLLDSQSPDTVQGYINGTGNIKSEVNYMTSGWIRVSPSTLYHLIPSDHEITARCVACYDNNRTYISNTLQTNVSSITTHANAAYIRVSYQNSSSKLYWKYAQVSLTQAKPYQAYSVKLKQKYLLIDIPELRQPQIVMPSAIYALEGYENSIYHSAIMEFQSPFYYLDKYGGKWNYYDRYFRNDASSAGVFSAKLKSVIDLSTKLSINVPTNIGDPTTDDGEKVINVIGDSFTYNGAWFNHIYTICPNLRFVGMRRSFNTDESLRAEGRGGWKLSSYFAPYGDLTPTHMQPFSPFVHVSGYTYYGPIEFWKAVVTGTSQYTYGTNGFGDYISWFDNNGYKVNPTTNDLMYDGTNDKFVYWDGSAWTDFVGEPTFEFDYSKYIQTWNIDSPDYVLVMLGVNDWFGEYSDELATTWNERMNIVIDSIREYATGASKTITIGICTNTTVVGLPNNSYYANIIENSRHEFFGRKNTIDTFDNAIYKALGVFVVDTGACLDNLYGFTTQQIKPFAYYEGDEREPYDSNGVHPSDAGYKQLGTCAAGFIQYMRAQ